MKRGAAGRDETGIAGSEKVRVFVPAPLPSKTTLRLESRIQEHVGDVV